MRAAAAAALVLLAASPASAYFISAQSLGAGGFQDSQSLGSVEAGAIISDPNTGNFIDGHAQTSGEAGGLSGWMTVSILNYINAQPSHLLEKQWQSSIEEQFDGFQLDPGATELVFRAEVLAEDHTNQAIAPSPGFDNGDVRTHLRVKLIYFNQTQTPGLSQIQGSAGFDHVLPLEPTTIAGVAPIGYGTASATPASGEVELRIPASEVSSGDFLLVSALLYGEVRGGHWNGAIGASQAEGSLSFSIEGGSGVPQNPLFLSVPEPADARLGGAAAAGVGLLALRRRPAPAPP